MLCFQVPQNQKLINVLLFSSHLHFQHIVFQNGDNSIASICKEALTSTVGVNYYLSS